MLLLGRTRRLAPLLLVLPLAAACGGRTISRKAIHGAVVEIPQGTFGKDDISIESVSSLGGNSAIAEAKVRTALRLERVGGSWVVREVKIGRRPWERLDTLLAAVERAKGDETRKTLDRIAEALARYRSKNGKIPEFRDYLSLSDSLYPDFLNPLVRHDAWGRPLAAYRPAADTVRIVSPGPDGQLASGDDIELVRTFK